MIARLQEKIRNFFTQGHERTILTKKNIVAAFGIKGVAILLSMVLIPLTINYINSERNGIWLTLYSIIFWLNLFDIGLSNGMKNKLTEAKARGENELAKRYVSTTYAVIGLICLFVFLAFCLVNPYLDWVKILNLKAELAIYRHEISGLVWIFVISFCFTFVLNPLKSVVLADMRPVIGSFLDMIGQALTLIGVFILFKTTTPSLIYLGLVTGFAPVVVYIVASFYLFNTRYRAWKPSFRKIEFKLTGSIMNLGIQFFIASIAFLVINQTLSFLILRISDGAEVTNFNTAFRVFYLAFNVLGIIIVPYWSSFTDAYTKRDFEWMQKSVRHLRRIFICFVGVQIVFLILSPIIYYIMVNYWIQEAGNLLSIPFLMSAVVCIYVCVNGWLQVCINPLNGIGKVKLQTCSSIIEILALVPVAFFAGRHWGVPGLILTPVVVYIPRMIWAPIQLNKLIYRTAKGIWNK
jgi:O-antigen/teichoic acid export membrane protein